MSNFTEEFERAFAEDKPGCSSDNSNNKFEQNVSSHTQLEFEQAFAAPDQEMPEGYGFEQNVLKRKGSDEVFQKKRRYQNNSSDEDQEEEEASDRYWNVEPEQEEREQRELIRRFDSIVAENNKFVAQIRENIQKVQGNQEELEILEEKIFWNESTQFKKQLAALKASVEVVATHAASFCEAANSL